MQAMTRPEGSSGLRAPGFSDIRHMKEGRLSALRTDRVYHQGKSQVLISVRG
jgi:hypothetical protein